MLCLQYMMNLRSPSRIKLTHAACRSFSISLVALASALTQVSSSLEGEGEQVLTLGLSDAPELERQSQFTDSFSQLLREKELGPRSGLRCRRSGIVDMASAGKQDRTNICPSSKIIKLSD